MSNSENQEEINLLKEALKYKDMIDQRTRAGATESTVIKSGKISGFDIDRFDKKGYAIEQ
jgi:hypothetical protein